MGGKLRFFLVLLVCLVYACGGTRGFLKTRPAEIKDSLVVKKGDTLSRIAKRADISTQYLAEYNNIDDAAKISVGQKIYIPKRAERRDASASKRRGRKGRHAEEVKTNRDKFVWPVSGRLGGLFGPRHGTHHDGIDIFAKRGTKVVAADDGHVVYSGRLSGYGHIIVIRHPDDYFTAYAHNAANLVKKGKKVKRGKTVIAKVGKTGNASGPHLHFEVRYRELPRNPLFYLPTLDDSR